MRARRTLLVVLVTLGLVAGVMPPAHADATTDTYIVQLKSTVSASAVAASLLGGNAKVLGNVHAAVAHLTAAKAASIASNPNVVSIHKDITIKATGQENNAPWDLDLLDNRTGATDFTYNYPNTGTGVTVYVVDSGLIPTHTEFASATILPGVNFVPKTIGKDLVNGVPTRFCGPGTVENLTVDPADTVDQLGHGTAVASLVVGAKDGVAKGATIVPVRILDCDGVGRGEDYLSALNWILANHTPGTPAVVNVSLGADGTLLNSATDQLIAAGITVVIAAGNENIDACNVTPASTPGAITAAAVTASLTEPSWPDGQSTNWGKCIDLYAPGDQVVAANWKTPTGGNVLVQGTSFSSPLVAGAAAQVLADHPGWLPAQVAADLSNRATDGVVQNPHAGTPNKLLNVGPLGTFTTPTVTIDSYGMVGDTATAVPTWSPTPTTVTYRWSSDGTPIAGQTDAVYTLVAADAGKSITVTVTGSRGGYADASATSAPIIPKQGLIMAAGAPTIRGLPGVGFTLTAVPGTWDPGDATLTYKWRRNGVAITGATGVTYAPTTADVGRALSVSVTGRLSGYSTATAVSPETAAIQSAGSALEYNPFVQAVYQDFLFRAPSASDISYQSNLLWNGSVTKSRLVGLLAASDERLSTIVTDLYVTTLGRAPDYDGLMFHIRLLQSGMTVAQLTMSFYASAEYYQRVGGTNETWVAALYAEMLKRSPEAGAVSYWSGTMRDPSYTRSRLSYDFFQSYESRLRRVTSLYQTFLGRDPEPSGAAFQAERLLNTSDVVLAANLAESAEYWQRCKVRFAS